MFYKSIHQFSQKLLFINQLPSIDFLLLPPYNEINNINLTGASGTSHRNLPKGGTI